jgi:seryl-tRNA synthetase
MDIIAEGIDRAPGIARSGPGVAQHLFRSMGVDGVYARTGIYEEVVGRLNAFISQHRPPSTEVMRFPPVMSRSILERSGYLKSFPNLLGCVCALDGTETEIRAAADRHETGGDWTASLAAADLVLTPAACYPMYPIVAARGVVPAGGLVFDVACDCFRREPSRKLDRLQSFRMREYVCIGSDEEVTAFRTCWIERGQAMAAELQLPCSVEPANDPFFGRVGQVMGISQRQQALKFELLVPLYSPDKPTACMSFNYHRDHFGKVWGLEDASGNLSHTGCAAFGLDRLAVALFWIHGHRVAEWPEGVRRALQLEAYSERSR